MSQPAASPFPADALASNRAGALTEEQRRGLLAYVRNSRGNNLTVAAGVVVVGVFMLTSRSFAYGAAWRPVLALAAFGVAAALVLNHLGVFSRVLKDARAGRVDCIEGAISKQRWMNQESAQTGRCLVQVNGRTFVTGYSSYHAMPDAGFVRLYYLPSSKRVVNLELAERPQTAATLDSPAALGALVRDSYSLNSIKAAEARATLAGIGSALEQSLGDMRAPPPPHERDPRPLAQAIVGSWRGGPFSLELTPDGTATVTPPIGTALRGRWSVDAAGHLHVDAMGRDVAGEAWVAGDTLSVAFEGRTLAFRRA